jgi:hypothetical protein
MKKAFLITIALLLAASVVALSGCAGKKDPVDLLGQCQRAVDDYVQQGGYLRFEQEVNYSLGTTEGQLDQRIAIEGNNIFPNSQAYNYIETVKSSLNPNEAQQNTFSYLTLDQGKTAFVKGERLSTQLGVAGWVHYTPPSDQNRYFDLPKLIQKLTGVNSGVEQVGYEDQGGTKCVHLRYTMSGQELVDLRMQEDPSLQQKFQGLDLSQVLGDLSVELWLGDADSLPRLILMDQEISLENDISSSSRYRIVLSGWGEEPPSVIEAPAFFNEAV